ncbi:MAG: diguanylate cyclase [Planctomycetes bacterium]|nr:diguanylate cyclase [Planctomycetota bacterium]
MTQSSEQEKQPRASPVVLHDELVEILAEDMPSLGEAEKAARLVLENHGDAIYTDLVWNLTNLRFEPEEAKRYWREVIDHKYFVSERLGRNVGIRIASLDYFTNILGKLARPRVVDPDILERLYRDATVDPLTGLVNRRCYRERLVAELNRSKRYLKSFVLVVFDLDNFKKVNDAQGHAVGDQVLRSMAEVMRKAIRDSDTAARWGGEEFVLLMPETPKPGGAAVADRIRKRLETDLVHIPVTVSGGLALFPADGQDEDSLFLFADRALYRAKSEGKNRICLSPSEQRAFPRLREDLKISLSQVPESGSDLVTRTSNISAGGLGFRYHEPVEVSKTVQGKIEAHGRELTFVGRVVHVRELGSGRYEIGVQFVRIPQQDQELILSFTT